MISPGVLHRHYAGRFGTGLIDCCRHTAFRIFSAELVTDCKGILEIMSCIKPGLHDAICLTDTFALMAGHCVNFKAMRYELTSFNRIVADKSLCVKLSAIRFVRTILLY